MPKLGRLFEGWNGHRGAGDNGSGQGSIVNEPTLCEPGSGVGIAGAISRGMRSSPGMRRRPTSLKAGMATGRRARARVKRRAPRL